MPQVTLLYAGILGLMAIVISAGAGLKRAKLGISIGDGGNTDLLLAMRRHANFIENVPLALILIGLLEVSGVSPVTIHVMGIVLVVARFSHAVGLKADTVEGLGRLVGAAGSALLIVTASIWAIVAFFTAG